MKRITPVEVLEAYEKTGLKPMQGDMFPKEGCACGMGAYAYNVGLDENKAIHYLNNLLTTTYVNAYGLGFDSHALPDTISYKSEIAVQGYQDGKGAWEAVKHLAEVTP